MTLWSCNRLVSSFFGTKKPIYYKIIESALSTVDYIFESVPNIEYNINNSYRSGIFFNLSVPGVENGPHNQKPI